MAVKISWGTLKGTPDSLTLYWDNVPFTELTLPANSVAIPPTSKSYRDGSIPVNTTRYYMVKATKAGYDDRFSQCLLFGNFPNTGPGSSDVLRGDWNCGLMDILTPNQLFTIGGLKDALGLPSNFAGSPAETVLTQWYKFVYKGKILFFPGAPLDVWGNARWEILYNAGLMYGEDNTGSAPTPITDIDFTTKIATLVNQKKTAARGEHQFLVRQPRVSNLPTNTYLPAGTSYEGSEWWDLMCRMTPFIADADALKLKPEKAWGDQGPAGLYGWTATPHFASAANQVMVNSSANWSGYMNNSTRFSNVRWVPVLEYLAKLPPQPAGVYRDGAWTVAGRYYQRAHPIFTSAAAVNGFEVFASNSYDSNYPAWKGMDFANPSQPADSAWLASTSGAGNWLAVSFPTAKRITGLALKAFFTPAMGGGVESFRVESSNDKTTWTTVYTHNSRDNSKTDFDIFADIFDVTAKMFRVVVTGVKGGGYDKASIFELLFLEP